MPDIITAISACFQVSQTQRIVDTEGSEKTCPRPYRQSEMFAGLHFQQHQSRVPDPSREPSAPSGTGRAETINKRTTGKRTVPKQQTYLADNLQK
jgi:hypothetical protein